MNLAFKATGRVACGLALVAWPALSIVGPLLNGTFSGGNLNSWTTLGTAMAVGTEGNIVPVGSGFQALIASGSGGSDAVKGPSLGFAKPRIPHKSARSSAVGAKFHPSNPSPNDPTYTDVPEATLEAALNLPSGAIQAALPNNFAPTNGSVIYQTFTATPGTLVSFHWNFATNEIIPSQWDAALYSVGFGTNLAQVFELADTTQTASLGQAAGVASPFSSMTGYHTQSFVLPAGGTYTVGFLSMQTGDDSVTSGTYISNVQVGGDPPSPTPIPPTWSLGLLGFGLMVVFSGMRKLRQSI